MGATRRRSRPRTTLVALATQVKPTFMAPALAASVYGGLLASGVVDWEAAGSTRLSAGTILPAALHLLATFLGLYFAHVRDGYVDGHVRDEDDTFPLSPTGSRLVLVVAGAGFLACVFGLWRLAGPLAAGPTLPLLALGYCHAPWLDRHPVGTSADYAVGVALVLLGGAAVASGTIPEPVLGVAATFLPVVAAGAVVEDVLDFEADRRISKRTVAVVVGVRGASRLAAGLVWLAAALVAALVAVGVFPTAGLAAAAVLAVAGVGPVAVPPRRAVHVLMTGLAVASVLLLVAVRGLPAT